MIARLQRWIALTLLTSAVAWTWYFSAHARPALALEGAVAIVLGHALFLAAEFALLWLVQTDAVAPRPRLGQLLVAWWREILVAPQVFMWRQPFRSEAERDSLASSHHGVRGVVLVHGFVCNRALWNPWMTVLRARGIPFVAVSLEPPFASIGSHAGQIEEAVRRLEAATAQPVVLVGHSMGGLVIRAWHAKFRAGSRVHHIVTIGSPHHGTWLARFGRTTNGREMRQTSPWLRALAMDESRMGATPYARFTCFFGHCDNIVFPAPTATLPGACNVHLPGTPHVGMAFHPHVLDEVLRRLQ